MKKILLIAGLLLLISSITANTWVNHTYDETDWTIYQAMSYNGYNLCQAYLDVVPLSGETFLDSATESQTDFQLVTTLSYGSTNYCNVSFEVYGVLADLNISINYTQQHSGGGYFSGYSTIYGPNPSEYSESEGYYAYDVRSINHADYTSVCGDTFTCIVDVINNTDDSIAYIQVIAGYYDCSIVPPYAFNLSYDGTTVYSANTSFYPISGGFERSNLTILSNTPYTCVSNSMHSCYIEIYNTTDGSTLYVGNLSAVDYNCLIMNPGTTPGINQSGFGGGAGVIFGVAIQSFILICCFLIILIIMCTVKPAYFGILISVLAGDFLINVMQLMTIPASLYLLINALAIINFFRGVRG